MNAPPPPAAVRPTPPLPTGDPREVLHAPEALTAFVDAGVLGPADVHVAEALARHGGDDRREVLLAAALAVRAPRRRHVCVDLTTVRDRVVTELTEEAQRHAALTSASTSTDTDLDAPLRGLPWPEPAAWRATLAASPLVAERDPHQLHEPDDDGQDVAPLTLAGQRLYLDRYWRYERRVAAALDARARATTDDLGAVPALAQLFTDPAPDRQRLAAATAVRSRLTVLAGGPGTGKTTTVARLLQVLAAHARATGAPTPNVALAAPTGKAAARLSESLREAAERLDDDDPDLPLLRGASATTLHRLLGARGRSSRFTHDAGHPLPHDVVVVDETSMVPLALLAKLLDAVRNDARLVLVGDPHQLASVEAGSVLADVVGDPEATPRRSSAARDELSALAGAAHLAADDHAPEPGLHDAVVVLDRIHRFREDSGLDRFATAVRRGDADAAIAALTAADDLTWLPPAADEGPDAEAARLAPVRTRVAAAGRALLAAAEAGDGVAALAALDEVRILCAHRRGRAGVEGWVPRCEAWLRHDVGLDVTRPWYVGRPVLITSNDRRQRLWNGDIGVVVRRSGTDAAGPTGSEAAALDPAATSTSSRREPVSVALPGLDGAPVRHLTVGRLGSVETVHAMTVHKSQGSQVRHAVVVLPEPASRLCTRELLYTAVTRARDGATVIASEATLRATIAARTQRASGLGAALRP